MSKENPKLFGLASIRGQPSSLPILLVLHYQMTSHSTGETAYSKASQPTPHGGQSNKPEPNDSGNNTDTPTPPPNQHNQGDDNSRYPVKARKTSPPIHFPTTLSPRVLLETCQIDEDSLHKWSPAECVGVGEAISNITLEPKP
ncbi:hypothetical protein EDD85DRAFT_945777 [Armillaria nabsnona]|nr:hypothetical protein EDD85DRAFT_945777 [Armillaria nabsnona]